MSGNTEGDLDNTAPGNITGQLEHLGATGPLLSQDGIGIGAPGEYGWHAGDGQHIVNNGGSAKQTFDGGQGRLGTHHTPATFQTLQHRGLFTADIGAGTDPNSDIKVEV